MYVFFVLFFFLCMEIYSLFKFISQGFFISHFLGLVISRVLNVGYDNVWKISRRDWLVKIEGKSRNKEIGTSEKKKKEISISEVPPASRYKHKPSTIRYHPAKAFLYLPLYICYRVCRTRYILVWTSPAVKRATLLQPLCALAKGNMNQGERVVPRPSGQRVLSLLVLLVKIGGFSSDLHVRRVLTLHCWSYYTHFFRPNIGASFHFVEEEGKMAFSLLLL